MRDKTLIGLERFEVDKTRAFSLDFPEIRKSRKSWKWDLLKSEITEILDILEMGRCNKRPPQGVDPLTPGSEKKKSEVKPKSSFKSAENRAASSL